MKNFIMVHLVGNDSEVRLNKNLIAFYYEGNDRTVIGLIGRESGNCSSFYVRETPEEIDAMIEEVIYDPDERL